jgi:cytochrome oxidase Cu insertion factor (SCO1/SenC/PrrC family)
MIMSCERKNRGVIGAVCETKRRRVNMRFIRQTVLTSMLAVLYITAAAHSGHALEVGDKAPDFELDSSKGGKVKLSSLKGKNVLINFYVLDFSPT